MPPFRDPEFLKSHIQAILRFYHPTCIDRTYGGYINQLRDDGSIFDRNTKHLVGTCRFIFNYAVGTRLFPEEPYREALEHGVDFLQTHHRDKVNGGYAWILEGQTVVDPTRHCYGHAFVLLALATAQRAGLELTAEIDEVYGLLEAKFWREEDELYVDEISPDWREVSPYRGQNANMHMCEALLAAFEATGTGALSGTCHEGRAARLYRPGLTSRRLDLGTLHPRLEDRLGLQQRRPAQPVSHLRLRLRTPNRMEQVALAAGALPTRTLGCWNVPKASSAPRWANAGTDKTGGMRYTFGPQGNILDTDRYYWVLAETIAAAALLAVRTGDARYWRWYDRLWAWSWTYLVDTERGGWYRLLDENNQRYDDLKSPPSKTDYHPLGACYDVIKALGTRHQPN